MVYIYFRTEKVEIHKIEYMSLLKNQLFKALPIKQGEERVWLLGIHD